MSRTLVISDVDGTLVTTDKKLTERNRAAAALLDSRGILFSIVSSRPPFGLKTLSEKLALRYPLGAYNGGMLVDPDMKIIEQKFVAPDVARKVLSVLSTFAVDAWLFTSDFWALRNVHGDYIDHEIRAAGVQPKVIERLEDCLDGVTKIVGVSADFSRLASCQQAMLSAIGNAASIARSQPYYLDITPAGVDKGTFVAYLMRHLRIPRADVITIGDMENDVAMFRQSGFSIAMGNATADVRKFASATTLTNDQDGFADAVERLILPRVGLSSAGM
jgi:Cof subfamily protein (haloacid dehalogenase superfamily)